MGVPVVMTIGLTEHQDAIVPEGEHPHVPGNHEIETATGGYVDVSAPDADSIHINDIASALSKTCRFGGHCRYFYSVAEHAVLAAQLVARANGGIEDQLAALHHDDAEAYLGDIPRPIKTLWPGYKDLTRAMDEAICKALWLPFGPDRFHSPFIKNADNTALALEAHRLLPSKGEGWTTIGEWETTPREKIFEKRLGCWPPATAESAYLKTHEDLWCLLA